MPNLVQASIGVMAQPAGAPFVPPALTGPSDTFVAANGTALQSHTPTGANAGSGWTVPSGTMVITGNNARAGSAANGPNRGMMSNDLGTDQMDVEGDFQSTVTTQLVTIGVNARRTNTNAGIEFSYDFSTQKWGLADAGGTASVFSGVEAWPGGTVVIRLICRTGLMKGYVNGLLKLTLATNAESGNTRAGLVMACFTNSGRLLSDCLTYRSQAYP